MLILCLIQKVVEVVSLKVIWHRQRTAKFISCGIIVELAEDMRTKVVSSLHTSCLSDCLTPCFVCRLLWLFMNQLTVSSTASLFVRRWFVSVCLRFLSQADVSQFARCYGIFFNVPLLNKWTRGINCHPWKQENFKMIESKSFGKRPLGIPRKSWWCHY